MELTRQADYALRCVLETARHDRLSARELAERQQLSPSFVGKIVSVLARAGILETHRGATGGVQLARPAATITVLEVIEAIEGPIRLNRCVRTPPTCTLVDHCVIAPVIRTAQDALTEALSVTLEDLMTDHVAAWPSHVPEAAVPAGGAGLPRGTGCPVPRWPG